MIYYFIFAFLVVFNLCFFSNVIAKKTKLIDYPHKDKIHTKPTPLVGGIILLTPFLVSIFAQYNDDKASLLYSLYLYIFLIFLIGLIDDKVELNAYNKILFLILVSVLFLFIDKSFVIEKIYFQTFDKEYYFGKSKFLVTLLCIILLFIAINMADGINGLIILIVLISLIIFNLIFKSLNFNILSILMIITLVILFFFNYSGKLFLGDSGASLLASYLIYLTIYENYNYKIDVFKVISPFMVIGFDMVRLFFIRILNKKNPFKRDNMHFHHILYANFGLNLALTVYIFLSFTPIIINHLFGINILLLILLIIAIYFFLLIKTKIKIN